MNDELAIQMNRSFGYELHERFVHSLTLIIGRHLPDESFSSELSSVPQQHNFTTTL